MGHSCSVPGGSPTSSRGRGPVSALSQGPQDPLPMSLPGRCLCSRPPQDLLLQGFGAKLLSCCRAQVWPPDGDLHPQRLLSITGLPLQKCLLLSPCPLQLYLQIFRFCIPAWDCPRHLRSAAKPQTHWMCSGRTGVSPGGLQQVPPPPRAMGLGEPAAVPRMHNQRGCELHIAEIPKLLGQFHTQAGVWGMLSCCPLGS